MPKFLCSQFKLMKSTSSCLHHRNHRIHRIHIPSTVSPRIHLKCKFLNLSCSYLSDTSIGRLKIHESLDSNFIKLGLRFTQSLLKSNPQKIPFKNKFKVKAGFDDPNYQNDEDKANKLSQKKKDDFFSEEQNTILLTKEIIEISMLSAISGLAFYLSTLLRVDAYFACFFPLPLVIASLHWNSISGLKTLVTTFLLLSILGGPLKALSYLFMHGLHGLSMGVSWRIGFPWFVSIIFCTIARFLGLLFFVILTSWLLKKNLLYLAIVNSQTLLTHMLSSMGSTIMPSILFVYAIAMSMILLNCAVFVILLHVLYSAILPKMGINMKTTLPSWAKVKLNT